jgi:hypothetical protein
LGQNAPGRAAELHQRPLHDCVEQHQQRAAPLHDAHRRQQRDHARRRRSAWPARAASASSTAT